HHERGLRRLLALSVPTPTPAIVEEMDNATKLTLAAGPDPNVRATVDECALVAIDQIVAGRQARDQDAFTELCDQVARQLPETTASVLVRVLRALEAWRTADRAVQGRADLALLPSLTDMQAQLARLVHPGFVAASGP